MAKIAFIIPQKENENRRVLLPEQVSGMRHAGEMLFEEGYGNVLGFSDQDYINAGAGMAQRKTLLECPVICNPKPVESEPKTVKGKTLFGYIHAVQGRQITDELVNSKMTVIAWEDMFDGGRHVFWRNNEIAGEASVMNAFLLWGKLPYENRVAVIGRGNVARGAIRALERFGCNVVVYDRKTSPLIRSEIGNYDVIVNAVLWDVFRKDRIIYDEDLDKMKPGSLIIDISCDDGMEIQSSRPTTIEDPIYTYKGIVHYVVDHTPTLLYKSASRAISQAISPYVDRLAGGEMDAVLENATIIRDGKILDDRIIRFQGR